jgi:predicted outer membrane repeat protein
MRTAAAILLGGILLLALGADATIWYVPDNFSTIQAGINGIFDDDTLIVREGTWYENLDFNGQNVVLASLFLLDGDPSHVDNTVIDGGGSGSVIIFATGEDSTTQVVGFTIQNGDDYEGGGIYCYEAHPTIRSNHISGNSATEAGGGIYVDYYDGLIRDNTVTGNSAFDGGGIYCRHSGARLSGNTVTGNSGAEGGGICTWYCWAFYGLTMDSCTIIGNTASHSGGGVFCDGEPIITNSIISGNWAQYNGGGIYCSDSTIIRNCTVTANSAGDEGGGVLCRQGTPTIVNTILWGDSASAGPEIHVWSGQPTVIYCDIEGGWPGTGNINADPMFVCLERYDFHLRWHSPCIDAGHPSLRDPDRTRSDIGAFYFNQDVYGISELYPHNTPIIIPPQGGHMVYDMWVFNFVGHPGRADIWTMAFVPGVGPYGPINLYRNVRIPADSIGLNDVGQNVPGPAPAGDYVFAAYVGTYPSTITDSSYFYFSKSGSVGGRIAGWFEADEWLKVGDLAESTLPGAYALSQNYPNPFNAKTVISYQLPADSHVKLEVFNTLGQKVATLADERQQAGYRSVSWDASEVSSGIYFYRLTAAEFTQTRRMMLIR